MKKYWYIISMALVFGMTACSESIVEEPANSGNTTNGKTEVLSYVSVYADESATQPLIENAPLTAETSTLGFPLAYGLNEVYVNYPTKSGVKTKKMPVTTTTTRASDPGTYEYFQEGHRYVELIITKPEDAIPAYVTEHKDENGVPFTAYHSSGVVMFEDTWPSKSNTDGKAQEGGLFFGDYNDLVVDYDLETNVKGSLDDIKNNIESVEMWRDLKVTLHFRAKGGAYAHTFGLKLENLLKEFVRDETPAMYWSMSNHESITENDAKQPFPVEVKWDSDNHPVILVKELNKLRNKAFMSSYGLNVSTYGTGTDKLFYNTVNDAELNAGKGLFTLTVTFRENLEADHDKVVKHFRDAVADTRQQNFFIVTTQAGKEYEIHLAGYKPTGFYAAYYNADKNDSAAGVAVEKDASTTYRAADGNVWGFKTPVLTRHATEQQSFATAFPNYAQWITTGNENYALWYLLDNANMAVDEDKDFTLPGGQTKKALKYIIEEW